MDLIHFIWVGGELPEDARRNIARWVELLERSGWKILIWTNRDCAELRAAKGGRLYPHTRFAGPEHDTALTMGALLGVVPQVYFFTNRPGSDHCHIVCYEDVFSNELARAVAVEIEYGLKPIASDILRLMVLRKLGGWYIDAGDAALAKASFPTRKELEAIAPLGFACHFAPQGIAENDIIYAAPQVEWCGDFLDGCLLTMARYYANPRARLVDLERLCTDIETDKVQQSLQKFVEQLREDIRHLDRRDTLLARYASILRGSSSTSSEEIRHFMDKNIHPQCSAYFRALEATVNSAGFHAFTAGAKREKTLAAVWEKLKDYFTDDTQKKCHYSWKTPGLTIVEEYQRQTASRATAPVLLSAQKYTVHAGEKLIDYAGKTYAYDDEDEKQDIIEKIALIEAGKRDLDAIEGYLAHVI